MKKRGFTLIELLAVIVILAIIALIATPIILGIINDAREQSKKRTAELIAKEVELAYTSYLFEGNGVGDANDFCSYMTKDYFTMDNGEIADTYQGEKIECDSSNPEALVKSGNDYYGIIYEEGKVKVYYLKDGEAVDFESPIAEVTLKEKNSSSSEPYAYLWYENIKVYGPSIGEDASELSTTLPSDRMGYLKFKLDSENKVTNIYACAKFNGTEERCLEGGPVDTYGWGTSKTDSTGRVAKIYAIEQEGIDGVWCEFDSTYQYSRCGDDSGVGASLSAYADGHLWVSDNYGFCRVNDDNSSYCYTGD